MRSYGPKRHVQCNDTHCAAKLVMPSGLPRKHKLRGTCQTPRPRPERPLHAADLCSRSSPQALRAEECRRQAMPTRDAAVAFAPQAARARGRLAATTGKVDGCGGIRPARPAFRALMRADGKQRIGGDTGSKGQVETFTPSFQHHRPGRTVSNVPRCIAHQPLSHRHGPSPARKRRRSGRPRQQLCGCLEAQVGPRSFHNKQVSGRTKLEFHSDVTSSSTPPPQQRTHANETGFEGHERPWA